MLREITPLSDAGAVLYEGPTGLEGWKMGNMGGGRSWSFREGRAGRDELRLDRPGYEAAGHVERPVRLCLARERAIERQPLLGPGG